MSFEFVRKLPIPSEIKEQYPVPEKAAQIKIERDKEIKDVFTGDSDKFLVIIGPCSADNEEAVLDYTTRLVKVQEKVKDKLIIIPRVYTNKPRTTGTGYKGMLHQPPAIYVYISHLSEFGTMSHHTVGVPFPTFLPVLYSSKVSTELWRRCVENLALITASFNNASKSSIRGNFVPHLTQNCNTPVS